MRIGLLQRKCVGVLMLAPYLNPSFWVGSMEKCYKLNFPETVLCSSNNKVVRNVCMEDKWENNNKNKCVYGVTDFRSPSIGQMYKHMRPSGECVIQMRYSCAVHAACKNHKCQDIRYCFCNVNLYACGIGLQLTQLCIGLCSFCRLCTVLQYCTDYGNI